VVDEKPVIPSQILFAFLIQDCRIKSKYSNIFRFYFKCCMIFKTKYLKKYNAAKSLSCQAIAYFSFQAHLIHPAEHGKTLLSLAELQHHGPYRILKESKATTIAQCKHSVAVVAPKPLPSSANSSALS
jgi:hypothetical protein